MKTQKMIKNQITAHRQLILLGIIIIICLTYLGLIIPIIRFFALIICSLVLGAFPYLMMYGFHLSGCGFREMFFKGVPREFSQFIKGVGTVLIGFILCFATMYVLIVWCNINPDAIIDGFNSY